MGAASYEIFKILVREHKSGDLSYLRFCEVIDEFAVEEWEQQNLVEGIAKYTESLPSNNNSYVRSLDFDEKSELAEQIADFIDRFHPQD